jgi:hypothetical protein
MLHENNRKKKLHIPSLRTSTGVTTNHIQKEAAIYDHFVRLLGKTPERTRCLNCDNLGYSPHDLTELEAPFEENEIKSTISQLLAEKSPGPDDFIGLFYKKCWPIVKQDLIVVLQAFHSLRTRRLELINEANIILLPKKDGADNISDFRPISL